MKLTVREIVEATGGRLLAGDPAGVVTGVSTDSRTVSPDDLFVPLRGPRLDGHAFIDDAFARGAAASLTAEPSPAAPAGGSRQRRGAADASTSSTARALIAVKDTLLALGAVAARYRERLPVTVVGITGSVGKTSTARMTTAVLATRLHVAATKDDWNAEIGVPMMLLGLSARTQVAVIEMAMRHLGDIHYLVEIARPSIGVVTNIAESHMELLGSLENIVRAKGELIEGLPADGIAVLNAADPLALGLQRLHRGRVLTYGMESAAAVRAADITGHAQGSTFRLMTPTGTIDMALPVPGWHQVSNALAACAVATALDVDLEGMREGLARYTTPKMRLQVMPLGAIDLINDAYNASPLSTRAALAVLAEVAGPRRKLVVFGDMLELGSLAVAAHRAVGDEMARAQIAGLVTIGDLARHVAERARAGGVPEVVQAGTWQEGVEAITAMLRPGDVLLVKASRGMALERVVEALVARVDRVAAPPGRPEASSSNRLGRNG